MSISKFHINWCLKIHKKLESFPMSKIFFEEINNSIKNLDNNKQFKTLNDIQNKFNGLNYSLNEWIHDMRSLFGKIINFYQDSSIMYLIGKDLNNWFEKKISIIPNDQKNEWLIKFKNIQLDLPNLINKNIF